MKAGILAALSLLFAALPAAAAEESTTCRRRKGRPRKL